MSGGGPAAPGARPGLLLAPDESRSLALRLHPTHNNRRPGHRLRGKEKGHELMNEGGVGGRRLSVGLDPIAH